MDNWNEIRTAAQVARLGTISAAAEALGVHRATVTRHIDQLEDSLGTKLFQRHARGFTPTALGLELLRITEATDEQFCQFHRRAQGQSQALDGELIVTAVNDLAYMVMPALKAFRAAHPLVKIHFIGSATLLKLQYGEAHVAVRVGPKPEDPDNVVSRFATLRFGLYASTGYIERHGRPDGPAHWPQHHFVGGDQSAPQTAFVRWMAQNIPEDRFCLRSNQFPVLTEAILSGIGIGFLSLQEARSRSDLVEIIAPRPEWDSTVWTVTHVDLHRTAKVRAFLDILRETGAATQHAA